MNKGILNRAFHRWNPVFRSREVAIFAELISDRIGRQKLSGDMSLGLHGSGVVPERLQRKVGTTSLLLRENALPLLSRETIARVLAFGIDMSAGDEFRYDSIRAYCASQVLMVEGLPVPNGSHDVAPMSGAHKALAELYTKGWKQLVELHHRGMPAIVSPDGETISYHQKRLIENCMTAALRIVQEEAGNHTDHISDQFAVVLAAGVTRGPSLFSDVDFIIVSGETTVDARRCCDDLAHRLEHLLRDCGIEPDNLVTRFSDGKSASLAVDDLFWSVRSFSGTDGFIHALTSKEFLPGGGCPAVYQRFCTQMERLTFAPGALHIRHWRRFYLKQYRHRQIATDSYLLPAAIWLREITIFYILATTYTRLKRDSKTRLLGRNGESETDMPCIVEQPTDVPTLLTSLVKRGWITTGERDEISHAYEFFAWLRNATGLFYHTGDRFIRKTDLPYLERESTGTLPTRDLLRTYTEHARLLETMSRRIRQLIGHSSLALSSLSLWAMYLQKADLTVRYLRKGDSILSSQPISSAGEMNWK